MHTRRPSAVALVVSLALAGPLLSACGGGGGGAGTPAADVPPATAAPLPIDTAAPSTFAPVLPDASGPGTPVPLRPTVPPPDFAGDANGALKAATFDALNALRAAAGSGRLAQDRRLDAAAQAHADWLAANPVQPVAHEQLPGSPGFAGRFPADRAAAYGPLVNEGLAVGLSTAFTCADLGRVAPQAPPFLWPADDLGIGISTFVANGRTLQRCVLVTGTRAADRVQLPAAGEIAVYPSPGTTVSLGIGWGSTIAMSLYSQAFRSFAAGDLVVTRLQLADAAGNAVPIEPVPWIAGMVVFRHTAPLVAGNAYTVRFEATVKGTPIAKTWSFAVAN